MKSALKAADWHLDEVIFDTCITANLETASAISDYADYMQASEETSSGRGNEYCTAMTYLAANPDCSIPELSKVQINATRKMLATPLKGDDSWTVEADVTSFTQPLTRLSEVKSVVKAFNLYSKKLFKLQKSKRTRSKLNKTLDGVKCFNQDELAESRTVFLDLGNMAKCTKKFTSKESVKVTNALKKAVIINKYGKYQKKSTGLYVYVPATKTDRSEVVNYIKRASVSKFFTKYIKLVKKIK